MEQGAAENSDILSTIKVLIVGEPLVVEEALQLALATVPGVVVMGIARDLAGIRRFLADSRPDVILMRSAAESDTEPQVIEQIVAINPDARVVVLAHNADEETLHNFVMAGAFGLVNLQLDGFATLVSALRRAAAGEFLLSADTLRRIIRHQRKESARQRHRADVIQRLTERELEILTLLGGGLDNGAIAEKLYVSVTTVRTHIQHLLAKLGLHSRLEAAVLANRYELAVGGAQIISPRDVMRAPTVSSDGSGTPSSR
jgi:DNA-binding NarL/FixJ family response regulator